MAGMRCSEDTAHKDLRSSEIRRGEKELQTLITAFHNFTNPFEVEVMQVIIEIADVHDADLQNHHVYLNGSTLVRGVDVDGARLVFIHRPFAFIRCVLPLAARRRCCDQDCHEVKVNAGARSGHHNRHRCLHDAVCPVCNMGRLSEGSTPMCRATVPDPRHGRHCHVCRMSYIERYIQKQGYGWR
ncbi:hypothetical protein LSAT2_007666 [Lamellibrachia satsuma]|nr:hypothetical protein LSAT2_007666 [Lamellibrachia satsuma]